MKSVSELDWHRHCRLMWQVPDAMTERELRGRSSLPAMRPEEQDANRGRSHSLPGPWGNQSRDPGTGPFSIAARIRDLHRATVRQSRDDSQNRARSISQSPERRAATPAIASSPRVGQGDLGAGGGVALFAAGTPTALRTSLQEMKDTGQSHKSWIACCPNLPTEHMNGWVVSWILESFPQEEEVARICAKETFATNVAPSKYL